MFDPFERLGLPRRFAISASDLEACYLRLSLATHPDHSGEETASAEVNRAYAELKDPFRRADALLKLKGGPSATDVKALPPAFLMEAMEMREIMESADAAQKAILVKSFREQIEAKISEAGAILDAEGDGNQVRELLNTAKTLKGLLRD